MLLEELFVTAVFSSTPICDSHKIKKKFSYGFCVRKCFFSLFRKDGGTCEDTV
jgi:hypothetical protein